MQRPVAERNVHFPAAILGRRRDGQQQQEKRGNEAHDGVRLGIVFISPASSGSSSASGSASWWIGSGGPIQRASLTWSRRWLAVFGWIRMERPSWFSISQGTSVANSSFAKAIWNIGRSCGPTLFSHQVPIRTAKRAATPSRTRRAPSSCPGLK
jgi:hypothetical protein